MSDERLNHSFGSVEGSRTRPENSTADTVETYAKAYERAHRRNPGLQENTRRFGVSVHEASVESIDDGFVARLVARHFFWEGGPTKGTDTAALVHGDGPYYAVGYYVTERLVRRQVATDEATPTSQNGEIVECF